MDGEKEMLKIIASEFPHLHEKISRLYNESSSFIEICEDYVLCLNSIKKAEKMKDLVRDDELIELRIALSELKEELLSKIPN